MTKTRWEAARAGEFAIPASTTLGFVVEPTTDPADHIVLSWVVPEEYCNSAGHLQGGVLGAFMDALFGGACAAQLPEDQYPALAEMKVSIFRPSPAGTKLTGTGRVLKRGKRLLFSEAEVTDESGKLVAKGSGTAIPQQA